MANEPKDFDFSDIVIPAENTEAITEQQLADIDSVNWKDLDKEISEQEKYGDRPLETGALAAASTASFSLSDRALQKLGIYKKEELKQLRERNPEADIAGTIVGAVAPAILSEGTSIPAQISKVASAPSLAATKASIATEKLVEKALSKAVVESGQKKIAQEVLKKSASKGIGSAVEGAAFGANQLLREDALGEADFNAENLMANAGIGALYGGVIGASLPVIGAGMKSGAKNFGRLSKKAFDPTKDAIDLTGFTPAQIAKMNSNPAGKNMIQELPEWYKTKVGLKITDSAQDILTKVENLRVKSASSIDDVISKIDDAAKIKMQQNPQASTAMRSMLYREVANDLYDKFFKPYSRMSSFAKQNAEVARIIIDLRRNARLRQPLTAAELRDFKRKMDKLAKSFYEGHKKTESATAAFAARDLLNKSINKFAEFVDPNLVAPLKAANKDYHYAESVLNTLRKKAAKDKDFVTFKDLVFGGIGYGIGDVAGLTIAAAKKAMNSDFKRKVSILSNIEKANKIITSKTNEAVKNFFSKSYKPVKMASIASLTASTLSHNENGEKPKTSQQAFSNIYKNLNNLQQNPEEFTNRLARSTSAVSQAAPMTAEQLSQGLVRGVNFLTSKLPKPRTEINLPGLERPYTPSSMEMAKFQRYVQIIEQPLTVLDEIQAGTVTREHIEALKEVYPNFYRRIQEQVLDNMNSDANVPYNKKVQLGILLDIPTDSSLLGKNISALQANIQSSQQAPNSSRQIKPTMSGARELKKASRMMADSEEAIEGNE